MTLVRSAFALASVAIALLSGCSGKSVGEDLTTKTDPTPPVDAGGPTDDAAVCHDTAVACDPGDDSVGNEAGCAGADYCYSRAGSCGATLLWCAHRKQAQCGAIPRCDQGDSEVQGCPSGGPGSGLTCYSRTVCGTTIQCLHRAACTTLPACNPGDKEVTDIGTCSKPAVSCYAVTGCSYTIHCYTP